MAYIISPWIIADYSPRIPCEMGNPEIAHGRERRRARMLPCLIHGVAYACCSQCDFQVPWLQRKTYLSCMPVLADRVALLVLSVFPSLKRRQPVAVLAP